MSLKAVQRKNAKVLGQGNYKNKNFDLGKDVNYYIKLFKNRQLENIDVEEMSQKFYEKPQYGDVLQYELHNYCKANMNQESDITLVIKLASICYSNSSVLLFTNIDRFLGCVYYICTYLLKNEQYKVAIDISSKLTIKKEELNEKMKKSNEDILNFLYMLYNSFISSATLLASQVQSITSIVYLDAQDLAMASVKIIQLISIENFDIAKKIIKKSKIYFHSLEYYKEEDILNFYTSLQTTLKFLSPTFCSYGYSSNCFFKIQYMKDLDYTKMDEVLGKLKKIIGLIFLLSGFSNRAKNCLNCFLNFFFTPTFNSSQLLPLAEECEKLNNNINRISPEEKKLFLLTVVYIFYHGIQYWWKLYENTWSSNLSVEILRELISIILKIHENFVRYENLFCSSPKELFDTCLGDLLTGSLQKIQYTLRLCLKNKLSNALSIVELAMQAFRLSNKFVGIMKGRCGSAQQNFAWKYAVIHQTNLIEDILRYPLSDETWTHIRDCSKEIIKCVLDSEFDLPYDKKRLIILYGRWHQALVALKEFSDAALACTALYASFPTEHTDIMSMWLITKSENDNNDIFQEMTICDALKKYESLLKEFHPKYDSRGVDKKSLLIMELKAYSSTSNAMIKHSKTSYNLIQRIWKQLEKMKLDIWETSSGIIFYLSAITIHGDIEKPPKAVVKKCHDTIDQLNSWTLKDRTQCRNHMYAANLRLSLFLCNLKFSENSEGKTDTANLVLDYLKKAEEEKVKFGDDVDLNLTCSILPSSTNLTIELETQYVNNLNEIVEDWKRALKSGMDELPTPEEFKSWLGYAKLVAYLYELLGEYNESLLTWLLFHQIAKLCNDRSAILLGFSHVVKNVSDVNKLESTESMDKIASELEIEHQDIDVLVVYLLTIASNHFKNRRTKKSVEYLIKVRKLLEGMRTTVKIFTLTAQFWCLVSQLIVFEPDFEVDFGFAKGTHLGVIVFKAFRYISAGARNCLLQTATQTECMELVLAMLEVNLWAFHFHEIYLQTDFMRSFLDDLYQIVQRLLLPIRTAEILARLAEVDLICQKITDCEEKVNKLKSILMMLSLSSKESFVSQKYEMSCKPYANYTEKINSRMVSPQRFLDLPVDSGHPNDVSPTQLHLPISRNIKFEKHSNDCKCRTCQNLLVQILKMTTLRLEGEILKSQNNIRIAAVCYNESHQIFDKLEKLRTCKDEILSLEVANSTGLKISPGFLDFMSRPVRFYSTRFLLQFGFFESAVNVAATDTLMQIIDKIKKLMVKFTYEEKLLMWKFGELKFLSLIFRKGVSEPVRRECINTPNIFKSKMVLKTPNVDRESGQLIQNRAEELKFRAVKLTEEDDEEKKSTDEKNTAFIGLENIPSRRKKNIQPKKLKFLTNEPTISHSTVKKAGRPKSRPQIIKPKKLNLD